nr:MAG TPA: hypothetical protein [Caudoviricetes sp.]DAS29113.1 MAG TPA: hypothetical protein [Caudoviricetes sp.]
MTLYTNKATGAGACPGGAERRRGSVFAYIMYSGQQTIRKR